MTFGTMFPESFSGDWEDLQRGLSRSGTMSDSNAPGTLSVYREGDPVCSIGETFAEIVERLLAQGYQIEFGLDSKGYSIKATPSVGRVGGRLQDETVRTVDGHKYGLDLLDVPNNEFDSADMPDEDDSGPEDYYDPFSDPFFDGWDEDTIADYLLGDVDDDGIPYGWDPGDHGD